MSTCNSNGSVLGATLLIAGMSIGAGALGIPVLTGLAGFFPAFLLNTMCWLLMLCTGLLFLEVVLWMPEGAHITSITEHFLGSYGKIIAGFMFAFLYFCLLIAYFDELVPLLISAFTSITNQVIGNEFKFTFLSLWLYAFMTLAFGMIVFCGYRFIDRVNLILIAGLLLAFIALIGLTNPLIQHEYLTSNHWKFFLFGLPAVVSGYRYHNIIPSISSYLKREAGKLRYAVILGTTIPFMIYSIWQWVAIGTINREILEESLNYDVFSLRVFDADISLLMIFFTLFAVMSSLLGIAYSMVDFFADCFKVKREGLSRAGLCLLVFALPLFIVLINPHIFLISLGYVGGMIEITLNAFLPIVLIWIGKQKEIIKLETSILTSKFTLSLLLLVSAFILFLELF